MECIHTGSSLLQNANAATTNVQNSIDAYSVQRGSDGHAVSHHILVRRRPFER